MAVKVPLVLDSTTDLPVEMSSSDTLSGVVYTTGTQTIGGAKTFSSSIVTADVTANSNVTINCMSGTDVVTINTPGSTPAGSFIAISSPSSVPGIIGSYAGNYRTDLRFGSGGLFSIGVSSSSTAPTVQYNFDSSGNFSATGQCSSVGYSFGSNVGSTPTDLSKHISLYGGTYGLSITGNRLNYVTPSGAAHKFIVSGTDIATIATTGLQLSTGKSLSKITLSTSAPGTLASGELYLQY